jgi:hypothetical protein
MPWIGNGQMPESVRPQAFETAQSGILAEQTHPARCIDTFGGHYLLLNEIPRQSLIGAQEDIEWSAVLDLPGQHARRSE